MKTFKASIVSNRKINTDFFELVLDLALKAKPGQFVELRLAEGLEPLLNRPFSIAWADASKIAIWYQIRGLGTKWLSKKKKNDVISGYGPLGNRFPKFKGKTVFVVGGCGVGPIRFLSDFVKPEKILIGGRSKCNVYGLPVFKKADIPIAISTDDGSLGYKGLVTDMLEKEIRKSHIDNIVAVGPNGMMRAVAEIAKRENIACWLSLESFMACGIGVCYGCSVNTIDGYKRVCKDGPVFEANSIIWED
jgi:dihydroorotate dehydrogenase electron transfer subunit